MRYLLDTNICIYLIRQKSTQIIQKFRTLDIADVGISTVTLSELEFGVEKNTQKARNLIALIKFSGSLRILPYHDIAAQHYGRIRHLLESQDQPIGPLDTMIAAHALALNCTLVTNNVREFRRIPNLSLENWV